MNEILIRDYRPADREACRRLWAELTGHHREIYASPSIGGDDPGAPFDAHVKDARLAQMWVAEEGGRVVGLCGLLVDGVEAEVEPVIVSKDLRSRGIGSRLLAAAKAEAVRRGARSLSIRPVARNAEAIAMFHEQGFRTLGHLEMFQKIGEASGPDRTNRTKWKDGITVHGRSFKY